MQQLEESAQHGAKPGQPAQEPFGYFRPTIDGWEDCREGDEGARALYEGPQPVSEDSSVAGQPFAATDDWRKYAKEREDTAQAVIERHRREHDSLLGLLAADRGEIERLRGKLAEAGAQAVAVHKGSEWAFHHNALTRAVECLEILNKRPRPMCRDCADHDGVCPSDGLDCNMSALFKAAREALGWVVSLAAAPQPPQAEALAPDLADHLVDANKLVADAVAAERERCAKLCEGMHPEDGPSDYAWTIRTDWAEDSNPATIKDSLTVATPVAQPQPLTDAEIKSMRTDGYEPDDRPEPWSYSRGVRDAERAHGIGQPASGGAA